MRILKIALETRTLKELQILQLRTFFLSLDRHKHGHKFRSEHQQIQQDNRDLRLEFKLNSNKFKFSQDTGNLDSIYLHNQEMRHLYLRHLDVFPQEMRHLNLFTQEMRHLYLLISEICKVDLLSMDRGNFVLVSQDLDLFR